MISSPLRIVPQKERQFKGDEIGCFGTFAVVTALKSGRIPVFKAWEDIERKFEYKVKNAQNT